MAAQHTLVLDNGGSTCRLGWAGLDGPTVVAPNAVAHQRGNLDAFVADQIGLIKNQGTLSFSRPCERGIVTNWPLEIEVWQRLLPQALRSPAGSAVAARGCTLCATCAPFTPDHLTACLDEIAFEEFGFGALQRVPAPAAAGALYHAQAAAAHAEAEAAHATPAGGPATAADGPSAGGGEHAALVVDLGYSCTYVVPVVRGAAVQGAVRRLNVGGGLLTALLQETVSFRQYNMMDEVVTVERAKEALCYAAPDTFAREAKRAVGTTVPAARSCYREWVLPDFSRSDVVRAREVEIDAFSGRYRRSREKASEQFLRLELERFAVPEALFEPLAQLGLPQGGLHACVADAVAATDPALQPLLCNNVVLVGGGALLPGLAARLFKDLRPLLPSHLPLRITVAKDPATYNWRGASYAAGAALPTVTKAQYEEMGPAHCTEKFRHW